MAKKLYYLAYGSNLNVRQMRYRCPGAKPIGISVIPDYELLYKGSKTGAYRDSASRARPRHARTGGSRVWQAGRAGAGRSISTANTMIGTSICPILFMSHRRGSTMALIPF